MIGGQSCSNCGASLYVLLTRLTLRQDVAEELMQDFLKLNAAKDQGGIDCRHAYTRRMTINLAFDWLLRQS